MSVIKGTPTAWTWGDLVTGDIPDLSGTYQVVSEKGANNGYCGLDASGLILDSDIPAGICRDSELSAHVDLAGDPHANATGIGGYTFGVGGGHLLVTPVSGGAEKFIKYNAAGSDIVAEIIADADIPASICRDSELTTHVDSVTPHANATSIGGKSFGLLEGNLLLIPADVLARRLVIGNAAETGVEVRLMEDADIPAAIARDTEVPDLASASVVTGADLPVASAAYVGILKIHRVTGDNKSSIYICVQNDEAVAAYEWVQLAIST